MVVAPKIILEAMGRDATAYGIIAVVTLMMLLLCKELASASERPRLKSLSTHLDVVIIPLFTVFIFIVITKVIDIIG